VEKQMFPFFLNTAHSMITNLLVVMFAANAERKITLRRHRYI